MEISCTNCGATYTYADKDQAPTSVECICRSRVLFK